MLPRNWLRRAAEWVLERTDEQLPGNGAYIEPIAESARQVGQIVNTPPQIEAPLADDDFDRWDEELAAIGGPVRLPAPGQPMGATRPSDASPAQSNEAPGRWGEETTLGDAFRAAATEGAPAKLSLPAPAEKQPAPPEAKPELKSYPFPWQPVVEGDNDTRNLPTPHVDDQPNEEGERDWEMQPFLDDEPEEEGPPKVEQPAPKVELKPKAPRPSKEQRKELIARARALREAGSTHQAIADTLGISKSTAHAYTVGVDRGAA